MADLDDLLHHAPVALYRTTRDGKVVHANAELLRILGAPNLGALQGIHVAQLYHYPADRDRFLTELHRAGGNVLEREVLLRRIDGAEVWVRDAARATLDPQGRIVHIDGVMHDITAEKEARAALLASEARYRELVEHANDVLYTFSPEGRLTNLNGAAERLFGAPLTELEGRSVFDLVHPEDLPVALEHHRAKVEGREEASLYELRLLDAKGQPVWVEVSSHAVRHQGRLHAIHGSIRDIRRRKAALEELERTRARLGDLIEHANDIVYTHDFEGRFLSINATATRILGYSQEELLGMSIQRLLDPSSVPRARESIRQKLEGFSDRSPPYEVLCRAKDGSPVWLEVSTRLLRTDGQPTMIQGIARDVTQRRYVEARLRESEARYRSLFERLPVGLFRSRADGAIEDANPALVRMLGFPDLEALRAVNLGNLYVDPEDRRVLLERLDREGAATYEFRLRRADGAILWVRGSSSLVRDPDGGLHYEGHLEDITAERTAEQGLRLVQEMALELEGAGDFPTALGASLRKICRAAGWSYGEAWVPNAEGTALVASESWFTTNEKAKKFRHLSARLEFPKGLGAPGLAWQTGRTVWWPDAVHEPQFQRAAAAKAAGFRSLCAVPVLNAGRLVAVLVFLTDTARDAGRWVQAVESVARQLGTVMGRRVAEDVLRRQTRVLEAHLESSPDGVLVVSDAGEVVACNRRLLEMCEAALLPGAGSPSRWTGQALLAHLDDPARFQARVRFLYEDPGQDDELVVAGRRYKRTSVPVRDEDELSWGRIWTFRELGPPPKGKARKA